MENYQLEAMRQMVAQRSWVRTPFQYTTLGAGLSLVQQQALLLVSEHLQTYIKRFYELRLDRAKDAPKSLFTEHVLREGIPPFRIWLQDLGILPSNYDAARKAIDEINLQVEHQEFDSDGNPTGRTIRTNVFSQFGFESSGDYYHYRDGEGREQATERMNPYIDVKINPDVAMWAFDMSKGYVNHLKLIAFYSTKRPTPRTYMLLMRAMTKNDHQKDLRVPLAELKEYLGIKPYKDKQGNMVTPYPMFSNFRQKVLDAVRDDLLRMSRVMPPTTDITFTYEPIYPGRRKKGDPEAILFHITRTILGDAYNIIVNKAKPNPPIQLDLFPAASVPSGFPAGISTPSVPSGSAAGTSTPSVPSGSAAGISTPVPPASTSGALQPSFVDAARAACYTALKSRLSLTGADVWFDSYDPATHTVYFKYDRSVTDRLTDDFTAIVKQYFGPAVVIILKQT